MLLKYMVWKKRVNEAVKNNSNKFPDDYFFQLTNDEYEYLRSKFSTEKFAKIRSNPNAFSEKSLYMIAKILKISQAIEATFANIETFSKIRELSRHVRELSMIEDKKEHQSLMQRSGELIENYSMMICKQVRLKQRLCSISLC